MTAVSTTTLLVIEDNPGDARLIREMMRDHDAGRATVIYVGTIGEAEKQLAGDAIDVILLDLGLPDAQGLDAVRRVHAAAPHVPLVILTGIDDESVATQALQIGAQDYLVKGQIEPRGLSRALRYAVDRNVLDGALFAEKERAQVTLDSIGDAVASTDLAGGVTFLNAVGQDLAGWSLDEARGRPIGTVLNLRDGVTGRRIPLRPRGPSALEPSHLPADATLYRRDGRRIAVEGSLAQIHERTGQPAGAVIVFRDVTERRVAERATRRSEERFERLFDANTIGITITDLEGRTLEANDAFLDMLGYTREELLSRGLGWNELTPPEYRERTAHRVQQLLASGVGKPWEKEYIRRDGTRVPVMVGAAVLTASAGTCITYVVDLSGRRLLEDQLRQAHKMEAIGQVAGGIAHDFSNLLTVILGNADLLVEQLTEQDPIRDSAEEIRDAGNRAATMTRQLLAFSRRQILEPEVLDVNGVVTRLDRLLRRLIGAGVELVTTPAPNIGRVRADASQIDQVLLNLAVNARDAMPDGGALTIDLGETDVVEAGNGDHRSLHPPGLAPGPYVTIAVGDTGVGMSRDTMAHMFEPFFTTKDRDKGTGLGLATAYGIVTQSGGDIAVASVLGEGATFTIYLPRLTNGATSPAVLATTTHGPREIQTLLLVEDQPAVRRLTRRILEDRGYRVLEAADGRQALEAARLHDGPIHLLLTNVVLPLLDGGDLARQVTALRPETAVVYVSGLPDDPLLDPRDRAIHFIQKPYTAEALTAKLREAAATPTASQSRGGRRVASHRVTAPAPAASQG